LRGLKIPAVGKDSLLSALGKSPPRPADGTPIRPYASSWIPVFGRFPCISLVIRDLAEETSPPQTGSTAIQSAAGTRVDPETQWFPRGFGRLAWRSRTGDRGLRAWKTPRSVFVSVAKLGGSDSLSIRPSDGWCSSELPASPCEPGEAARRDEPHRHGGGPRDGRMDRVPRRSLAIGCCASVTPACSSANIGSIVARVGATQRASAGTPSPSST
jgi:hypothetical protein